MIRAPLAIDICCGLFQSKLGLRAYSAIKQFVAGRTKHPYHMPLAVLHHAPSTLSFKSWAVRNLDNSSFSAGFTIFRKIGIFSLEALKSAVFILTPGIVDFLNVRLAFVKRPALRTRCFARTILGAISLICVGGRYQEVIAASAAASAIFCSAFVFSVANSRSALRAIAAAPFFIWPDALEWLGALPAKQIIHIAGLSQ